MTDSDKVIQGLECCREHNCEECYMDGPGFGIACRLELVMDALRVLKEQPCVVRCRDCKYRSDELYHDGITGEAVYVCQINDVAKEPDWFCADGVKKDD